MKTNDNLSVKEHAEYFTYNGITQPVIITQYDGPGPVLPMVTMRPYPHNIENSAADNVFPTSVPERFESLESADLPNNNSDLFDQKYEAQYPSNYPLHQPSSRFSSMSPYMTEKLSLGNRAQEQGRQRMLHASPIITPSHYQTMLLEGNIKELKKMLCELENTYGNTSLVRFITRAKLWNQIKDIKRVLQKSHARDLDTVATGNKQRARDIIMTEIIVDNPELIPFAIQCKEAQFKIYRKRISDWAQEFLNKVKQANIATAKQHIQEWAEWNFADPVSNNIAHAFLTHAHNIYQNKCQQHKNIFLARIAIEGIDPVLDILDSSQECDTAPTVQQNKTTYSPQYQQYSRQHSSDNITLRLIQALNPGDDRIALAHSVQSIVDNVFTEARTNNHFVASSVTDHAYHLINDIKTGSDYNQLTFTLCMADNLLCDIQSQSVSNTFDNMPSFLERSRSLMTHAATVFAGRLNPVTRVQETIDFFTSTARFVSTITAGKYYLSRTEYNRRISDYWDTFNALSPGNLAKLSAEQWVEIGASIAGDFVLGMGITKTARYLKEIQAVVNAQKKAADIAKKLKRAVTTGLKENPYIVTAEGMVLRMSAEAGDMLGGAKEVLNNANAVLKSFHEGLMRDLAADLNLIKGKYDNTRRGFGELSNKFIKPNYGHILGFDLRFDNGLARIGGCHHDMRRVIQNSGIIEFRDMLMNKNGFYKAKLWHNGHYLKDASFFPAHWTKEQVMECILEVYDNFKKSGVIAELKKNGKYKIIGITNGKVEIEMYITRGGELVTAYPIVY